MEDQKDEAGNLGCNVVLINPKQSRGIRNINNNDVDKHRLSFLEEELGQLASRLATTEKSNQFLLAQLLLIHDWIESSFDRTQLIDTNTSTYQKWIKNYNMVQVQGIANQIKYNSTKFQQQQSQSTNSTRLIQEEEDTSDSYPDPDYVLPEDYSFAPSPGYNNNSDDDDGVQQQQKGLVFIKNEPQECTEVEVEDDEINEQDNNDEEEMDQDQFSHEEISTSSKSSSVWAHFKTIRDPTTNKITSNHCLRCGLYVSPQPCRLNKHLAKCQGQTFSSSSHHGLCQDDSPGMTLRKQSSFWNYFITTRETVDSKSKIISNICKNCGKHVSPQPGRMRSHLIKCTAQLNKSRGGSQVQDDHPSSQQQQDQHLNELNFESLTEELFQQLGKSNTNTTNKETMTALTSSLSSSSISAKSIYWKYFITLRDENGRVISNNCIKCNQHVSPQRVRLCNHLMKCLKSTAAAASNISTTAKPSKISDQILQKYKNKAIIKKMVKSEQINNSNIYNEAKRMTNDDGDGENAQEMECSQNLTTKSKCWTYFKTTRHPISNKILQNKCKACNLRVSPQPGRMKRHLIKCIGLSVSELEECSSARRPMLTFTEKIAKKARLASYFSTTTKLEQITEACLESNIVQREATMSTCLKCGLSLRSNLKTLIDHLIVDGCDPVGGAELKILLRTRKAKEAIQCEECGKILIGNINRHMLIHTNIKPDRCGHCAKYFRAKSQLKLHILTVHKGVKVPRRKR